MYVRDIWTFFNPFHYITLYVEEKKEKYLVNGVVCGTFLKSFISKSFIPVVWST